MNWFLPTGTNSLESVIPYFEKGNRLLCVHNTHTEDSEVVKAIMSYQDIYFCTCPRANLYIEDKLPDYSTFLRESAKMTVGTDSLASNYSLSILEELKIISEQTSYVGLPKMLEWATVNGAELLGFSDSLGTIRKGKTPGINLLTELDLESMRLLPETKLKKLC